MYNTIKNFLVGSGAQIITNLMMFLCRTIFIKLLGENYLGVNGLFSNILGMLSLAELGITPAIVYALYKPVAQKDEKRIAQYMNFYKKAYWLIATVIAVIGLSLVPFLEFFIKDSSGIQHLRFIYIIMLSTNALSYLFAYKTQIFIVDQKNYVTVLFQNAFLIVQNIVQIVVLYYTRNFIIYILVQFVTTMLCNILLYCKAQREYTFLKKYKRLKLDKQSIKDVYQKVRATMMHKLGGFILNSTDNLVLSAYVGLGAVGLYSNYVMIIGIIQSYMRQVFSAVSASIGNLVATTGEKRQYEVFRMTYFVSFCLHCFCFACFWTLFEPFITLWIGAHYVLDKGTVFVVLVNFYLYGTQGAIDSFVNASGLFWRTRYKPVFECLINLGVSVYLAKTMGIIGVFIGTLTSYIFTGWIGAVVLYKDQFKIDSWRYFVCFAAYFGINIANALLGQWLCSVIFKEIDILSLCGRLGVVAVITACFILFIFWKTDVFRMLRNMVASKVKK